jgi:hypothetical protein
MLRMPPGGDPATLVNKMGDQRIPQADYQPGKQRVEAGDASQSNDP